MRPWGLLIMTVLKYISLIVVRAPSFVRYFIVDDVFIPLALNFYRDITYYD